MKSLFSFIVLAGIFTGCASLKLSLSEDLKESHDEYSVKGRQGILINQKLSFGEFRTTQVNRSWTKGSSYRTGIGYNEGSSAEWVNIISTEYIRKKQTVNFTLTDGTHHADVFAVSRFHAKDLQLGRSDNSILNIGMDLAGIGGSSTSLYYVQVYADRTGIPWQLVLDNQAAQAVPKQYTGVFAKSKNEYYTLVPATKLERNGKSGNTLLGSVGFEIRNKDGKALAAVSMIDRGMVFLAKTSAEERFLLANLCAALLLQEEIGG